MPSRHCPAPRRLCNHNPHVHPIADVISVRHSHTERDAHAIGNVHAVRHAYAVADTGAFCDRDAHIHADSDVLRRPMPDEHLSTNRNEHANPNTDANADADCHEHAMPRSLPNGYTNSDRCTSARGRDLAVERPA